MSMISWRSKGSKPCGTRSDVEEDAWTPCAPWQFPFTHLLQTSVSRT